MSTILTASGYVIMGDMLVKPAQCAGKYIMYTRSLAVRYCQAVARCFVAADLQRRKSADST